MKQSHKVLNKFPTLLLFRMWKKIIASFWHSFAHDAEKLLINLVNWMTFETI